MAALAVLLRFQWPCFGSQGVIFKNNLPFRLVVAPGVVEILLRETHIAPNSQQSAMGYASRQPRANRQPHRRPRNRADGSRLWIRLSYPCVWYSCRGRCCESRLRSEHVYKNKTLRSRDFMYFSKIARGATDEHCGRQMENGR